MTDSRVLLLHGVEHERPQEHWLWSLAESLRQHKVPVQYPQLPSPVTPSLEEWSKIALAELAMLGAGERIVVTHSLSCLLWLHLAPTLDRSMLPTRALMVAPPSNDILWEAIDHFAGPETAALNAICPTVIVGRATDDYRTVPLGALAQRWGADAVELTGHGHLTPEDGHGEWPSVLDWVLTGDASVLRA